MWTQIRLLLKDWGTEADIQGGSSVAVLPYLSVGVHMWSLFYHYLILISPSFDASGALCFLILGIFTYFFFPFSGKKYVAALSAYIPTMNQEETEICIV